MLRFVEELRRGWTDGRAGQADTARLPDDADSDSDQQNTVAEVSALAEQLNARVIELEAEVAALTGVLRLPGVKTWLLSRFHPDKHPNANAEERRAFEECAQMINVAYEVVERKT
jgi:hypothetical protein